MPNVADAPAPLPLTIVTPVLNGAAHIADALDSVAAQARPPLEHIVYDAGSTDGTDAIVRRYPACTLIRESDDGAHEAMNKGLAQAEGRFIAFLNADDRYLPGTFQALAPALEDAPAPDMILLGSEVRRLDGSDMGGAAAGDLLIDRPAFSGAAGDLSLLTLGAPSLNARFFRTEALRAIGGFDNSCYVSADRLAILQLALGPGTSREVPHLGFQYGVHPGSQTLRPTGRIARMIVAEHRAIADRLLRTPDLSAKARRVLNDWRRFEDLRGIVLATAADDAGYVPYAALLRAALARPVTLPALARTMLRKARLRRREGRARGAKSALTAVQR